MSMRLLLFIAIYQPNGRTLEGNIKSRHSAQPEVTREEDFRSFANQKDNYNIPKACLLNRSLVLAMVLKSNRSGL